MVSKFYVLLLTANNLTRIEDFAVLYGSW